MVRGQSPENVAQFHITVPPGADRPYFYSNRSDSYWYGESNGVHANASQGWSYRRQLIFNDLFIAVDGQPLNRSRARTTITPLGMIREYPGRGVTERLYFPDGVHALIVEVTADSRRDISLLPGFMPSGKTIGIDGRRAQVVQPKYLTESGLPLTMFLEVNGTGQWERVDSTITAGPVSADAPLRWRGTFADTCRIILTVAQDAAAHTRQKHHWKNGLTDRKELLASSVQSPVTDNPRVNKALFWARSTMNALHMDMDGNGFLAGIPEDRWYNTRATLLSLAGGVLVNGDYTAAKEIIRDIGDHLVTGRASANYGQVPERWLPGCAEYGAADVTPLLLVALDEYLRYSGDFVFAQEMYPVVYHATEGALRNRVTPDGYLVNDPGGTWMNARGTRGPWTPRDNRAVEVQALWDAQLQAGIRLARMLGFTETAGRWTQAADNLKAHFVQDFRNPDTGALYDVLGPDGRPDRSLRPNQIFVGNLAGDLVSPEQQGSVLRTVLDRNTYPWGVSTLNQTDTGFHPYRSLEPLYTENSALYNGLVWPWLSGPLVTSLVRFGAMDPAADLTAGLTDRILDQGMVGGIPRTRNAFSADLLPDSLHGLRVPSGPAVAAYAPALAEYLRIWNEDYFGIHPDAFEQQITFAPRLPDNVTEVHKTVRMGGSTVHLGYQKSEEQFEFQVQNAGNPVAIQCEIRDGDSLYTLNKPFRLAQTPVPVSVRFNYSRHTFGLDSLDLRTGSEASSYPEALAQPLHFLRPEMAPGLTAFRRPDHVLLSGARATHMYETARSIVDVKDPTGDDFGPGQSYEYPLHPVFAPGIFDLTGFAVRTDDRYVYFDLYFRNLVQPGWHPEYGFQLTYAAIGIHTGDSSGTRQMGMHAQYTPATGEPMQYLLYIGGGFRLTNAAGKTLVEYRPSQPGYPLADLDENKIHIAIPVKDFPQLKKWWKYTVITGGQQDYGGGGLGVFRSVGETPCLWQGGGKIDPGAPNWYDLLQVGFEQ